MTPDYRTWARICLFHFLIVSALGVVLRYKIILPLPAVQQKFLLYGHSHFAFTGWVSLALLTAMLTLYHGGGRAPAPMYQKLFWLACGSAWGMLLTFPFFGYTWPSLIFATLSIIFSYLLALQVWRDKIIGAWPAGVSRWFLAAVLFFALSSLGAFTLGWTMHQKGLGQAWSIGALYFFLHFQYNGWFFFALLGILEGLMARFGADLSLPLMRRAFFHLAWATIPAFILSALWMRLPNWVLGIAVISILGLAIGLYYLFLAIRSAMPALRKALLPEVQVLWALSGLALGIKFILQVLSLIPELTTYAFGYRPVVIGFLHLVLLGMVSFFLVGLFLQEGLLSVRTRLARTGLWTFVAGVILNELILMLQGLFSISYTVLPDGNYYLFGAVCVLFTGLLMLNLGQRKSIDIPDSGFRIPD
jgi:hypothetical protein